MSDKIDIHKFEHLYNRCKEKIENDSSLIPENKKFILSYLRDSELGKTIKKGQKKKIGSGRNLRVAGILKIASEVWFQKPFDIVTVKDMENFILKLEKGEIKNAYGTSYKSETQITIKKFLRKFWKWLKGQNKFYPEEVDWIDTSGESADVQALPDLRDSVEKMYKLAPSILKKAMIITLFDSGVREGEFLNLRIKDVEHLGGDEPEEKNILVFRIRHSKTFGRPVSLPLSSEDLRFWLKNHPDAHNPEALLWAHQQVKEGKIKTVPVGKAFFYNSVKRLGKVALGINVTPHMIRHTSATYYAPKLDRATFCKRYGWSFASKMPDRYIDWAKISEKKTVRIETESEISTLKKQNRVLYEELNMIKESLQERKKYDSAITKILEVMEHNPALKEKIKERLTMSA